MFSLNWNLLLRLAFFPPELRKIAHMVQSGEFPVSGHSSRVAWRANHPFDPLTAARLGVLAVDLITLASLTVFSILAVMYFKYQGELIPSGIVLSLLVAGIIFLAVVYASAPTVMPAQDFYFLVDQAVKALGTTHRDFANCGNDQLTKNCAACLTVLARECKLAESQHSSPRAPKKRWVKRERFSRAYSGFTRLGLVPDTGWGPYFQQS